MSLLRKVANNRGFTRLEENQSSESLPDAAGDPNNPTNLAGNIPSTLRWKPCADVLKLQHPPDSNPSSNIALAQRRSRRLPLRLRSEA